ncbi:MAG: extracellular solute-binding protein [Termitinemataceae bacterium]|nr:MAG: extracellular solute-binding protein [Termitinemataceae bacterium]
MKKLFLLCAALALPLVSCVNKADKSAIMVWLDNDGWADAVITAFNVHYPDIKVYYQNVGAVDTRSKVSLDGPADIGPDMYLMPHDHIGNAIVDGIMEPFPAELRAKYEQTMLETSIKTCTFEGEMYAVPISTENIALFYNKDLLGNTPVPKTFEEIKDFAEKWNDPQKNKWAMRWTVDDSYTNYFFLSAFGMQLFGPNMDDYTKPGWDTDAARRGVEYHHSFKKYFNVNVADATYDSTIGAFQRGDVPFTIVGPWGIEDAKRNGVNFGVTKLPTINGVQPHCFSGNVVAVISSYSKHMEEAFAFVDFLASVEGETIMYKVTGKMAAYKDISKIEGLRDDPYMKGIQEQSLYADPMPLIPEMQLAWDAQKELFLFTWDEMLTIPEAQKKAMETFDNKLKVAGKSR